MKPITLPPMPKNITGLKKDGTRDKRFKRGYTMFEMEEAMDEISGSGSYISQGIPGLTATGYEAVKGIKGR